MSDCVHNQVIFAILFMSLLPQISVFCFSMYKCFLFSRNLTLSIAQLPCQVQVFPIKTLFNISKVGFESCILVLSVFFPLLNHFTFQR